MDIGLAFFVYRRPDHTRKVLETIRKNELKKFYIFQDGLKDERYRAEWDEVFRIIKSIDFAETELHISDRNKGLANSIVDGINYVIARHEAVIALEDDIILGDGYLQFMDACFEKYKNNPQVLCIAGSCASDYITENIDDGYDAFFSYRMSTRAWGTWKNRWSLYDNSGKYLQMLVSDEELTERVASIAGRDVVWMARNAIYHPESIDSWAIHWSVMQAVRNGVAVTPFKALSDDIGYDGSGTNSTTFTSRYRTKIQTNSADLRLPDMVSVHPEIMYRTCILTEGIKIMPTPSINDLTEIEESILTNGLAHCDIRLDKVEFKYYLDSVDLLLRSYYNENTNNRYVRKIMEFYFTEKFLDFNNYINNDIYIDAACCASPWVFYLREKRGINAFGLDLHIENIPREYKRWYYLEEDVTCTTFPNNSVAGISMQSSFECLLRDGDKEFIKECGRILRPGGKVVISPLYLTEKFISAVSIDKYHQHNKDEEQEEYVRFDCMGIKRANHYDIKHLKSRVLDVAEAAGMEYTIYILSNEDVPPYDFPNCFSYLKFILVLTKK